jgi:hypothetical protein
MNCSCTNGIVNDQVKNIVFTFTLFSSPSYPPSFLKLDGIWRGISAVEQRNQTQKVRRDRGKGREKKREREGERGVGKREGEKGES